MRKSLLLSLIIVLTLGAGACKKGGPESPEKQKVEKPAASTPNAGLIEVIKKGKLVNYQSTTIGNAFESYKYLVKKEWKMKQEGRTFTVSFLGWQEDPKLSEKDVREDIRGKGLEVIFVVEPNGSYYVFMTWMIESKLDGKIDRVRQLDNAGVLAKIYGNQKI